MLYVYEKILCDCCKQESKQGYHIEYNLTPIVDPLGYQVDLCPDCYYNFKYFISKGIVIKSNITADRECVAEPDISELSSADKIRCDCLVPAMNLDTLSDVND